jgi:hypothetical protein
MVEFALVAPLFFLLLFFTIEGARFVLHYEMVNAAAREGARYAIVHGANSTCPSGPNPLGNPCDAGGENVKAAVRDAAIGLASTGDLFAHDPVWWTGNTPPVRGSASNGTNERGNRVTVFVDYVYDPILPLLPPVTISVESSLVVNN